MKPDIHPEYRTVVFEDSTGGQRWVCRTGTMTLVDSAGRVERFNKRYGTRTRTER
jgi:ribosomal protein L31